jgi:hypothetical protein
MVWQVPEAFLDAVDAISSYIHSIGKLLLFVFLLLLLLLCRTLVLLVTVWLTSRKPSWMLAVPLADTAITLANCLSLLFCCCCAGLWCCW